MDTRSPNTIFPVSEEPLLKGDELPCIAELMVPGADNKCGQLEAKHVQDSAEELTAERDQKIPAGYTYLSQFIAHDIVPDSHFNVGGRFTSHLLNLDSMYGKCPKNDHPILSFEDKYFHLDSGKFKTNGDDVIRHQVGENHTADMPELRNDENILVLQLHRLWQEVHNLFADALSPAPQASKTGLTGEIPLIVKARRHTLAVFHYIVIHDLLTRLVTEACHRYFFNQLDLFHYTSTQVYQSVPAEFSLATFRFGHSMLRQAYHLTDNGDSIDLKCLIRRKPFKGLDKSQLVQWSNFFNTGQTALPIDLFITPTMKNVPHVSNPHNGSNIAALNLQAGERLQLSSAEAILDTIATSHAYKTYHNVFCANLEDRKLKTSPTNAETKKLYQYIDILQTGKRTPLWLYTLHENFTDYPLNGRPRALGLLASSINCDVLRSAILECYRASPNDSLSHLMQQLNQQFNHACQILPCAKLDTMEGLTRYIQDRRQQHEQ